MAGAGLTEGTGVTALTGTVIRLIRPDGVLVIEADDPNVSVSLDGDDVTVAGAGPARSGCGPAAMSWKPAATAGSSARNWWR